MNLASSIHNKGQKFHLERVLANCTILFSFPFCSVIGFKVGVGARTTRDLKITRSEDSNKWTNNCEVKHKVGGHIVDIERGNDVRAFTMLVIINKYQVSWLFNTVSICMFATVGKDIYIVFRI